MEAKKSAGKAGERSEGRSRWKKSYIEICLDQQKKTSVQRLKKINPEH